MASLNEFAPGRGLVRETLLEFEVIGRDGSVFADDQGRFLFTHARALLISRRIRGKMWLMPHTPYSAPDSFCPVQRVFFLARKCSYITGTAGPADRARLCGKPMAPRTDRGHCREHAGKLLDARPDAWFSRVLTVFMLLASFRAGSTVPVTS